jgi:hypothetical protein
VLVEGKAQVSRGRSITVERAWLEYLGRESGAAFGAGGKVKKSVFRAVLVRTCTNYRKWYFATQLDLDDALVILKTQVFSASTPSVAVATTILRSH